MVSVCRFALILIVTLTLTIPSASIACNIVELGKCNAEQLCSNAANASNRMNPFLEEAKNRGVDCMVLTGSEAPVSVYDHYFAMTKAEIYPVECIEAGKLSSEFMAIFLADTKSDKSTNYLIDRQYILEEAGISLSEFVAHFEVARLIGDKKEVALEFGDHFVQTCSKSRRGDFLKPFNSTNNKSVPRYDVDAYCENVKNVSGGSYQIYNTCIDAQQSAYDKIKSVYPTVNMETAKYCEQVAEVSGGSYQILETCIQQESTAAGGKKKFKF